MPDGAAFASEVRTEAHSRAHRSKGVGIRVFPSWGKSNANGRCLVRVLLAFFTRGRMAPDGDLVNADWLCFDATEVEGN
jgi:hypothetical protein